MNFNEKRIAQFEELHKGIKDPMFQILRNKYLHKDILLKEITHEKKYMIDK